MAKAPEPVNTSSPAATGTAGLTAITLKVITTLRTLVIRCMVFAIKVYRLFLSPWVGNQCRFHPSCSHYAEEAINRHGPLGGAILTIRRLGKCHPWHEGGCDPVPPPRS